MGTQSLTTIQPRAGHNGQHGFAPTFPTLWPHMLVSRPRPQELPFPLGEPGARFFTLARFGIHELATQLRLCGRELLFPAYFQGVELEALTAAGVRLRLFPVHEGMRVDPDEVASLIGPATAGVYMIHYGGFPGPVRELAEVCRRHGVVLIEDCALALLSCLGDQPLGSFGDAGVFCLYKTIPLPDGGAVVLRDGWRSEPAALRSPSRLSVGARAGSSLLLNLRMRDVFAAGLVRKGVLALRQAAPRGAADPVDRRAHFDAAGLGVRMSDLSHRLLRHQNFGDIVVRRRENYAFLHQQLGDVLPTVLGALSDGVCPLFYPFLVRNRSQVLEALRARGVEIGEFWPDRNPSVPAGAFPEVDRLRETALWLPCHQDLTPKALEQLAVQVREVVTETRAA